jgi:hypothetical protein
MAAMGTVDDVRRSARSSMTGYGGSWWIGGGWSIDAAVGRVTREHHDIDLVILRSELDRLRAHLDGWIVWINEPGRFLPWLGDNLRSDDACFMARPDDGAELAWSDFAHHPDALELMVESVADGSWVYRRDGRVTDSLTRLGSAGDFLAPEVALLYKAPQHEVEKNAADFDVCVAHLSRDQRRWLREALATAHAGHPWLGQLIDAYQPPRALTMRAATRGMPPGLDSRSAVRGYRPFRRARCARA